MGYFFEWETMESSWSPLNTLATLTLFIPGLAVSVRRLHDVERSGWWILIYFTIIGIIFPTSTGPFSRTGMGRTNMGQPLPLRSIARRLKVRNVLLARKTEPGLAASAALN